jgi:hypothetical protein
LYKPCKSLSDLNNITNKELPGEGFDSVESWRILDQYFLDKKIFSAYLDQMSMRCIVIA